MFKRILLAYDGSVEGRTALLTSPKAFKNPIVVSAELAFTLAFSPPHTDCRQRGIPDFARSQNY
jgi:hypothetical protein